MSFTENSQKHLLLFGRDSKQGFHVFLLKITNTIEMFIQKKYTCQIMISGRTTCIWASMRLSGVSVAVYAMVIKSLQCSLLLELNTSCLHDTVFSINLVSFKIPWEYYMYVSLLIVWKQLCYLKL